MATLEQIDKDLVTALKAKDEKTTSLLRMVKASLKNKEIELQKPLEEVDVIDVLSKEAKKRKESALAFEQGGRADLAENEKAEAEMLARYLPAQLGEEEIKKIVTETIAEVGAASMADMGKVMGAVVTKTKGQADGSLVSRIVKEELNK